MNDELMKLPEGWTFTEIGEVCTLVNGKVFKPSDWVNEGIPIVRIQNLNDFNAKFNHFKGDINPKFLIDNGELLFAWSGTPGTSFGAHIWQRGKAILNQHIYRVLFNEQFTDKIFFQYAINEKLYELISKAHGGVGLRHVTKGKFEKTKIYLPPLNEQKRIVAKIEALQERSQRVKAELEAIRPLLDNFRQSVLAAAFRGDLTKDWREKHPDIEPGSELLERIKIERLKSYEQECQSLKLSQKRVPKLFEFQEILNLNNKFPDSWNIISLESACLFIIDCLHSTPKFTEKGIYCIDTTCIKPSQINWHKARKVSFDSFIKRTSRMVPQPGDVLFSREGTIGIAVSILDDSPKLCLGQRMMMFRFMPAVIPKYAEMYLQSLVFVNQYRPLIVGTTSPHINIGDIRKMLFLLPSIKEQKEIVKRIESLFKIADTIEQQYQKAETDLETLNQSILAKAFRGELVPQDPKDEPVSVLLERIRAERETHNKTSKQRKSTTTKTTNRSRKKTTKKPPPPDTPTKLKLPGFE